MNPTSLLEQITSSFSLHSRQPLQIKPFGEGLIHQTFLIEGMPKSWVLQGFNKNVFKYPERIASNLNLLSKLSALEPLPFVLPLPLANKKGETLTEVEGLFYRLFEFVKGNTIQKITDPNQAYLASKAYGEFADWGKEIKAEDLQESIPNFHRLDLRFSRFLEVLSSKESLSQEEKDVADFYAGQ